MTGYGHRQGQSHVVEVAHNSQYLEIGRARLKKFQQEKKDGNVVSHAHRDLNVIADALQQTKLPSKGGNTAAAEARHAMVLRILTKRQQNQQEKPPQAQNNSYNLQMDIKFRVQKLMSERDSLVAQLKEYKEQEKSFSAEIENLTASLSDKDKVIVELRRSLTSHNTEEQNTDDVQKDAFPLNEDESEVSNCSLKPPRSPENREVEPIILTELKKVKQRMEAQTLSQEKISEDLTFANEEIDNLRALLSDKLSTWDKIHGCLMNRNQAYMQSKKDVQDSVDEIEQAVGDLEHSLHPLVSVIQGLHSNLSDFRDEKNSADMVMASLHSQVTADRVEISELKQRNQVLQKQILAKEELQSELENRLRDIEESVQQTELTISDFSSANLESTLKSWKFLCENISSTRYGGDKNVQESLCGIDDELSGVENSLAVLVGALNEVETTTQSKEAFGVPIELDSLCEEMKILQSEILGLDSDKDKLIGAFESQNRLLKEQQREIFNLSQKNTELVSDLDSLTQDIDSKQQAMVESEQAVQALQTELSELSIKLVAESKSVQEFEEEAEEYKRAHLEATQQIEMREKDIEKLKTDYERSRDLLQNQLEIQEQERETQFLHLQEVLYQQSDAVMELEKNLQHMKESESDEVQSLHAELESTKESYEKAISTLKAESLALEGKVSSLSAFQAAVGTTLCDMTKSMEEVVGNLEAAKPCVVDAQNEENSLREQMAALQDLNDRLEEQRVGLQQRNSELEDVILQLQQEVEAKQSAMLETVELQSAHENKISETERQITKLVEELNNANTEIDELSSHREEVGRSLEEAHQRLREKEEQVGQLETIADTYSASIKQLQEEMKTTKSELATTERVVERLRGELAESQRGWELLKASEQKCSELELDVGRERHEKESFESTVEALSQEANELTSRLEEAQGIVVAREDTIERLSGRISEMEAEKEQSDVAHASVCEELTCSKAKMLALERDLGQRLEEARADFDAMADRLRNNEQVVSEKDRCISDLTAQSERKDAEIESLCNSRDAMILEVQQLSYAVEQYRGKLAQYGSIMGPIHDLNYDLDKLIATLESRSVDNRRMESELEMKVQQAVAQLEQSEDEVRHLKMQLSSRDADMDRIQAEAEHQHALLQQEISGLNASLQSKAIIISENQDLIEKLTGEISEKEGSLAQLKDVYQQEISTLNANLESKALEFKMNEDSIEKLSSEIKARDDNLAELRGLHQQEISELNASLESKTIEMQENEESIEKLMAEVIEKNDNLARLKTLYEGSENEYNHQLEQMRIEVAQKSQKIVELEENNMLALSRLEEQDTMSSKLVAQEAQLMSENEALRQAVARSEEHSLQQAEELNSLREQLQEANAQDTVERIKERDEPQDALPMSSNPQIEKAMLEIEDSRAIIQSQQQALDKSKLEQEEYFRQMEEHRAERDLLRSKNNDLERRLETQQDFQKSLSQSGGHISSEMEKLEIELRNAKELSEKQRESMEQEFCKLMEEERKNWENVVNEMDSNVQMLRGRLEAAEQSRPARLDRGDDVENLNAQLAQTEQTLLQKESELQEALRSKSELQDYVRALKSAHAHAVAVIESQISRVTGTLPLTSPDNILASLEPDTVRKIMVHQSNHGRWHTESESASQRESSTHTLGQDQSSSSLAHHTPPVPMHVENQDQLQSQQLQQPQSGLSEGGNSSEDQWERVSNGTAISEPSGNSGGDKGKHAGAGRNDIAAIPKGLVPFATRNLSRLWNLMAGDAPAINSTAQSGTHSSKPHSSIRSNGNSVDNVAANNDHLETKVKPKFDEENSGASVSSSRQAAVDGSSDASFYDPGQADTPDEFVEVSIDSSTPP